MLKLGGEGYLRLPCARVLQVQNRDHSELTFVGVSIQLQVKRINKRSKMEPVRLKSLWVWCWGL